MRCRRSPSQALVEVALVIPILLFMAFGIIGLGRLTQTQMAVSAVAREAARAGALADRASDARSQGETRGTQVAQGYALTKAALDVRVDASDFGRCGTVSAHAAYRLDFSDLPLLGWVNYTVTSNHNESVDGYRSQLTGSCTGAGS